MSNQQSEVTAARPAWAARRREMRPRAISISEAGLVREGFLSPGVTLPLVVEPNLDGVDLFAWAAGHRELIESQLLKYGAILFRGFGLRTQEHFEQFLDAISLPLMHYMEGATPRTQLKDRIYTSTEYPAEHPIAVHNELNYVVTWPMKILFYCVTPSEEGGATPICDVRGVFKRLDPEVREKFLAKGWMLVRNFGDGVSLPWQQTFRTDDRAALEAYCREARVECEWKEGDRLRTRQVRPAARRHPVTGEMVWFNHVAFWHSSSLLPDARRVFLAEFGDEGLPYNTFYGDGTPIEDEVVAHLRDSYDAETQAFPWQTGDLLLIENMLVAHGRQPYRGARKILTAMGEPCSIPW